MLTKIVCSIPMLMIEKREKLKSQGNADLTASNQEFTRWRWSNRIPDNLFQRLLWKYLIKPLLLSIQESMWQLRQFHYLTYFGVCCRMQFHLYEKNKNFATYYNER